MRARAIVKLSSRGPRQYMEDALATDIEKNLFVVADGFGGRAGARAAQGACEAIRSFLRKEAGDLEATLPFILKRYHSLAGNVLFNALTHANDVILGRNKEAKGGPFGGASVIAAFLDGDSLALANVGVCRAVLYRGEEAIPLVRERSYGLYIDVVNGDSVLSAQVPLRSLGTASDVEPEIIEFRVREGDRLFLSSDGISKEFTRELGRETPEDVIARFRSTVLTDNAAGLWIVF